MPYIHRILEQRILEAFKTHPVVILTGPRQVGKSTLLKNAPFLKGWRYLTLDDPDILTQAVEDPKGLLMEDVPTIIDEVQRHTPLFLTIKYLADHFSSRRFILSGSGNISLRESPRETLAGRAIYLHLTTFGNREMFPLKAGGLHSLLTNEKLKEIQIDYETDTLKMIWRGGLPKIVLARSQKAAVEILHAYIDTYIKRDIQDLVKVRHPERFQQLMAVLAKSAGWEANQKELSNMCGETQSNISRYMSLLKETGLLYEISGYAAKDERAYRQAKYYWFDSAVACFLSGVHTYKKLSRKDLRGRYFENFIFQQILCALSTEIIPPEIYYWRPKHQDIEVDFILKQNDRLMPLEVKSSTQLTFRDTRSLRRFLKDHPEAKVGVIIYPGRRLYPIASNIYALPWMLL